MASEWKLTKISDLCEIVRGASPRPIHDYMSVHKNAIPWVKISDATEIDSRFIYKTKERIREEGRSKSREVFKGDLIVSNSATPGIPRIMNIDACIHDGWLLLSNFINFDKFFCLYAIRYIRPSLLKLGNGSVFTNLKTDILKNFEILLPPLEEQKVIAHILSSLDDKIELNRQMNATLEAMAQALFKSWFVDFDPVIDNALAAGNPIPDELQSKAAARLALGDARKPLPADIQALFPSSFVLTEEMGWIPEGWEVCDFSKIALTNSESWSNKNTPKFITYVDLSNAKNGRISEVIQYKFENAPSRARRVLRQDDTIIGLVRPANKSFAYIFESGLTGSTGFAVMRPKCEFYRAFIYLSLTQQETIDYFAHIADGGAYPAIRPEVVTNHLITKPTNTKIIESFDRIVYPFFKKIGLNDQASKICSEKRDTLLPKLLSGELRIPDAENLAAEVL